MADNNLDKQDFNSECPHAEGVSSEEIFALNSAMSYEEYRQSLSGRDLVKVSNKYKRYLEEVEQRNIVLKYHKDLYDESTAKIKAYLQNTEQPDERITHETDYLIYLEEEIDNARTQEDVFLDTYINAIFFNAIRKLYTLAIVNSLSRGTENKFVLLLQKYLGPYLSEEANTGDKKGVIDSFMRVMQELEGQEDTTSNLYRELLTEAKSAYELLETEEETLIRQIHEFHEHIQLIKNQLVEYSLMYSKLKDPQELYRELESLVLNRISRDETSKASINYIINNLRKEISAYKYRREGLASSIATQKEIFATSVQDLGIFLLKVQKEQYDAESQRIAAIDIQQLRIYSLEQLEQGFLDMLSQLHQEPQVNISSHIRKYNEDYQQQLNLKEPDRTLIQAKEAQLYQTLRLLMIENLKEAYEEKKIALEKQILAAEKGSSKLEQLTLEKSKIDLNFKNIYLSKIQQLEKHQILTKSLDGIVMYDGVLSSRDSHGKHQFISAYSGFAPEGMIYERRRPFSEGLAAVQCRDGTWGFINQANELVAKGFIYEKVRPYSEGMAAVQDGNGKRGFINKNGEYIGEGPVYNEVSSFSEGFAGVKKGFGKRGFIDLDGNLLSSGFEYKAIRSFSEGQASVKNDLGKWGYINRQGEVTSDGYIYNKAHSYSQGFATVRNNSIRWGHIDKDYNLLHEGYIYRVALPFSEGFSAVQGINGKWGFIDQSGKLVHDGLIYSEVRSYSEGLAAVKDESGKWGFIDRQGGIRDNGYIYSEVRYYSEGFAAVKGNNGKRGFINPRGVSLGEGFVYRDAYPFSEGFSEVSTYHKKGEMYLDGEVVRNNS